jgi:nucleoside diphosphate kinase
VLKPDALGGQSRLLPKLLKRMHKAGFEVLAMTMHTLSEEQARVLAGHCTAGEDEGASAGASALFSRHVAHLQSGPVVSIAVRRENGVGALLALLGPQDPAVAKSRAEFSMRANFGADEIRNFAHCAETYSESTVELRMLFPLLIDCETANSLSPRMPSQQLGQAVEGVGTMAAAERQFVRAGASLNETVCVLITPGALICPLDVEQPSPKKSRGGRAGGAGGAGGAGSTVHSINSTAGVSSGVSSRQCGPYVDCVERLLQEGFKIVGLKQLHIKEVGVYE